MIGDGEPAFIIAEVAGSHEGDLGIARRMVEIAAECGVDAIKFQVFQADELVVAAHPKHKTFKEREFQPDEWLELIKYTVDFDLIFLADVFDEPSLEMMDRPEVKGYKIHLTNLTNPYMLSKVARTKKPIFLATGGATIAEIEAAIETIKAEKNNDIVLMYGYQAYPTKLEEINFKYMAKLRQLFQLPAGFLDHVDGGTEMAIIIPLVSLAWGACAIEKHFALDRSLKGVDYQSALNPDKLKLMVQNIREVESTFGSAKHELSLEELKYRNEVVKHIVARKPIPRGAEITLEMLAFKRSEPGLSPSEAPNIIGKTAKANIEKDEVITRDKVKPWQG